MLLDTILTLQNISASFVSHLGDNRVDYLLVRTNDIHWMRDTINQLELIENKDQTIILGLSVHHITDNARIDNIYIACGYNELNSDLFCEIAKYIKPKEEATILDFLSQQWQKNSTTYAITFFWTTRTDANFTLIADVAVSPAYQGKGLMKTLSLDLIERLEIIYDKNHELMSTPIHPATYLLFNPHDKVCTGFNPDSLEQVTCALMMKMHGRLSFSNISSVH